MDDSRFSVDEYANTVENADKVVFSGVQKHFFRKESNYFGWGGCGGGGGSSGSKLDVKQIFNSSKPSVDESHSQQLNPSSCGDTAVRDGYGATTTAAAVAVMGPELELEPGVAMAEDEADRNFEKLVKLVQIKGVGFDLLYTSRRGVGCWPHHQPSIKEYNVETPCKIIMAVVLVAYAVNLNGPQSCQQLQSFVRAFLDACRSAVAAGGPLRLLHSGWLSRCSGAACSKKHPNWIGNDALSRPLKSGYEFWRTGSWLQKFKNPPPVKMTCAKTSAVKWMDKFASLFSRA